MYTLSIINLLSIYVQFFTVYLNPMQIYILIIVESYYNINLMTLLFFRLLTRTLEIQGET